MVIDERHDHSLRIPRPDLTVRLGVPNGCNQCHTDKSPQWASAAVYRWYGHAPSGLQQFAVTLHDGEEGAPASYQALKQLVSDSGQPTIARATALSLMANFPAPDLTQLLETAARDKSPLLRRAAAQTLQTANSMEVLSVGNLLLNDPVRAIRIEGAEAMAAPREQVPPGVAIALARSNEEYIVAQELNADRPEAHLNLGMLFTHEGQPAEAEFELKTALSIDPWFVPAAVNLSDLYRSLDRDLDGEAVLRSALKRSPEDPALLYALGLLTIRKGERAQALALLAAAARLGPENTRYQYVCAIALDETGDT
jgi:tetratricopeptide (TPR) repeat protein